VRLPRRDLTDADLAWADMVMTGGMLPQQADTLALIELCRRYDRPVVIGGPDATSSPHIYKQADFRVLGEAEGVLTDFIAAWDAGKRAGTFTAPKFQVDLTRSPMPRFDLLNFDHYLYIGVQYSRGCPFTCEFCDIIELYGRLPRTKTTLQILGELDRLCALGYRGHVDFVDDNLIGNKKALKQFLPRLKEWQEEHDYPFEFSTEASVNLADDDELLRMMRDANFFALFVGIESPDPETLVAMRKKQNTRRNLVDSIHKIYRAGMFVTADFIVGFDSKKAEVGDSIAHFIELSAIPVAMVGLLYALPNTQLTAALPRKAASTPTMTLQPPPAATNAPRASISTLCGPCERCSETTNVCWIQSISRQPMPHACNSWRLCSIGRGRAAICRPATYAPGSARWNWCIASSPRYPRRANGSGGCS
jgi:radical SAM superfamily enzyme YgiQ (UPF0313 family)